MTATKLLLQERLTSILQGLAEVHAAVDADTLDADQRTAVDAALVKIDDLVQQVADLVDP